MKFYIKVLGILAFVLMMSDVQAGDKAEANFQRLKSLAGEWQGKKPDGKMVGVTYEVVSNGSVVMERMQSDGEPAMITMYHLDGKHLMMTHYCSVMNQPRMRATADSGDENVIQFSLLDVTNLTKATDGHMKKLAITFTDDNHIVTKWTFVENGKEKEGPFELERKR
jgi:hypothetical protein